MLIFFHEKWALVIMQKGKLLCIKVFELDNKDWDGTCIYSINYQNVTHEEQGMCLIFKNKTSTKLYRCKAMGE